MDKRIAEGRGMNTNTNSSGQGPIIDHQPQNGELFDRVAFILDQARASVVRSVNNQMVIAYWLIGREIVKAAQGGDERAEYGKKVLEELSARLSNKYGKGFSVTNLRYFRLFYQTYAERLPEIRHMACDESGQLDGISQNHHKACDVLEDMSLAVQKSECIQGFSPVLSWSHYRALTKVENRNERLFYELEAEKEGWSVPHLERQINTFLFARLLKSRDKAGVMKLTREGHSPKIPIDTIKDPYILDFLGLPDSEVLHESKLEKAIISNLQSFLLELGKGFAFVGRQKRLQFDDDFFYIDLVFYNCILKCYLLIDLKIGELTHQDVGQMDSYVRIFDDRYITPGDNPTIGLILCSKKNETIAKYSVLNNSKQLFASKYMLYLPTEEELKREIQHQRQLIEEGSKNDK
ncbi:MAG: PDDEXK nuclease domain-containing protein [Candidatus Methanoperedens sp.]|nr:PDDEXK nuclease domain-containing protein [Candidatus Methanoperedens sp.]